LLALVGVLAMAGAGSQPAAASGIGFVSGQATARQEASAMGSAAPTSVAITIDDVAAIGFDHPVSLAHAGDNSGRVFVVEQSGVIRIIQNGTTLPAPFLDISGRVLSGGEQGLLGLAFPPGYATKHYFYVDYTRRPDGTTVIARYTASGNLADPNSEEIILTVAQPFANHNGGQLAFSPVDGYLYIGMGDGGSAGDPANNAQRLDSLLGKLLRIDVESGSVPYAVPPSNPFVGSGTGLGEIWALGLRNPWRFSFDRANGDLYIGDVGQNLWEEIDFQEVSTPDGLNYGWRCKEATHLFDFTGNCPSLTLVDPIAEYGHDVGIAVIGGFVYRGSRYPALAGRYFYADFGSGRIWSIVKIGSNPVSWSAPTLQLTSGLNITSFGEDDQGEVYVAEYGGTIRRLRPGSTTRLPIIRRSAR
jgi:glucose/arabinose dehydrogenase